MNTPATLSPAWRPCTFSRPHLAEGAGWAKGSLTFVNLLRGDFYWVHGVPGGALEPLLRRKTPLGAAAPTAGAAQLPLAFRAATRKHWRWRATARSAASLRLCHRCHRSAT